MPSDRDPLDRLRAVDRLDRVKRSTTKFRPWYPLVAVAEAAAKVAADDLHAGNPPDGCDCDCCTLGRALDTLRSHLSAEEEGNGGR